MEVFIGQIFLFPYGFVPFGYMRCDGTTLNITPYMALFALIGTKFGGNGTTNFALPDLRNTSPVSGMEYYIATYGLYPIQD
jgi:microcystin-dependent protein